MKRKLLYFACLALFATGCSDFLDVVPKDKQTEQQLFATKGGFYTAANGIYNNIASNALYGRSLTYETVELLGKRYIYSNTANSYYTGLMSYDYSNDAVETNMAALWKTAYNTILNCNVVIDNVEKDTGVLSASERAVLRGEMLAVRAHLHFDMLRLFGPFYRYDPDVPAIPYNESATIVTAPIISADSVLKYKILRDLDEAVGLLAANDPVITDGPMASAADEGGEVYLRYRQLRMNYYAVRALRARVHLYAMNKPAALADAKALLEDPAVHEHFPPVDPNRLLNNNRTPDRVFSTEVLWAIYRKDRNEIHNSFFSYESAGSTYFLQPRDYLQTNIYASQTSGDNAETADYRYQTHWRTSTSNAGHDFIKYAQIDRPDANDGNSEYFYAKLIPLVRLAEVYYIAAESEPDFNDGYTWLNVMRRRRGVPDLTPKSDDDLRKSLRNEYIREFAGEGQVFFMYKRMAQAILNTENGAANTTVQATDAAFIVPLPASEILNH